MIDVTVKVDESRLAEFYAMYAKWMAAPPSPSMVESGARGDWHSDDADAARHVWLNMSGGTKAMFEILLDSADLVGWRELAKELGPMAGEDTVWGSFGPVAKVAKEVGRKHPIKTTRGPDGTAYWLEPQVRAAFEQVRRER